MMLGVGCLDTVAWIRRQAPNPCRSPDPQSARSRFPVASGAQRMPGRWICNRTGGGWRRSPLHNWRQRSRRRLSGSWFGGVGCLDTVARIGRRSTPTVNVGDQTSGMVNPFDHLDLSGVEVATAADAKLLNKDGAGSVAGFGSDHRHAWGVIVEHVVQDVEVHRVGCC